MTPGLWGSISALSSGNIRLPRPVHRSGRRVCELLARYLPRQLGLPEPLAGRKRRPARLDTAQPPASCLRRRMQSRGLPVPLLLLHQGPDDIAAPITGSYPAIVVLIAVALGSRPSLLQWSGTIVTLAGVVVVAHGGIRAVPPQVADEAGASPDATVPVVADDSRIGTVRAARMARGRTAAFAAAAAVAFALMISATQEVVPVVGNLQTLWLPRLVAMVTLVVVLAIGWARGRPRPAYPGRWWPVLAVQAGLDVGGYYTLYAAAAGPNPEIAAMTSSAYYVVTVLLGRLVLKERMNLTQIGGIVLVFAGVLLLSA